MMNTSHLADKTILNCVIALDPFFYTTRSILISEGSENRSLVLLKRGCDLHGADE